MHPPLKPHIFLYSNGLAIGHGLQKIGHIKVKMADQIQNGRLSAILNLIKSKFSGCILPGTSHFVLW